MESKQTVASKHNLSVYDTQNLLQTQMCHAALRIIGCF